MPNDARRRKGDAPATRLSPGLTRLLGAIALLGALGFSGLSAVGGHPTSALLASEPAATASKRATAGDAVTDDVVTTAGSSTSAAPASQVRSARAAT